MDSRRATVNLFAPSYAPPPPPPPNLLESKGAVAYADSGLLGKRARTAPVGVDCFLEHLHQLHSTVGATIR